MDTALQLITVIALIYILWKVIEMSQQLETLQAEITENTDVVDGVLTLLEDMADNIRANANDPAALEAMVAELDSNSQRLADAVAKNTPAEPTA